MTDPDGQAAKGRTRSFSKQSRAARVQHIGSVAHVLPDPVPQGLEPADPAMIF
jgi:hypothetical protein